MDLIRQVRRPHSVKKEKRMVQVKEGLFRIIVAKAGNKVLNPKARI